MQLFSSLTLLGLGVCCFPACHWSQHIPVDVGNFFMRSSDGGTTIMVRHSLILESLLILSLSETQPNCLGIFLCCMHVPAINISSHLPFEDSQVTGQNAITDAVFVFL